MFGDQGVLCSYIVIECDLGKWPDIGVRRRGGLAISKQSRDDDEVFLWI